MSSRRSQYRYLTAAAKQARQIASMREPGVACPHCDATTSPSDLLRHVEGSCPGAREPHQLSRWISRGEAIELGVPWETLRRWVGQGKVRSRIRVRQAGEQEQRRPGRPSLRVYLVRDVAKMLALRHRIMPTSGRNRGR